MAISQANAMMMLGGSFSALTLLTMTEEVTGPQVGATVCDEQGCYAWEGHQTITVFPDAGLATPQAPGPAANNGPQQPQQPQQPQKPQQPQPQKRTTFQTVCGNWGLVNIGWGSFNLGTRFFILASGPVAPEVATFNLVSSISNTISGLTRAVVCP